MLVKELSIKEQVNKFPYVRLDQFKNLGMMDTKAMDLFNAMCKEAVKIKDWQHKINSDYRENDTGQHGQGKAIDVVFYINKPGDVNLIEQFNFACRFKWGGIGFYVDWNAPGLHCDIRDYDIIRALWWHDKNGYHRADVLLGKIKWIK